VIHKLLGVVLVLDECPGTRLSEGGGKDGGYAFQRTRGRFLDGFRRLSGDNKTGEDSVGAGWASGDSARVREEEVVAGMAGTHFGVLAVIFFAWSARLWGTLMLGEVLQVPDERPGLYI
jgi:hypothetical protein